MLGLHAEVETEDTGLSVRMNLFIEPGQVALSTDEVSDWVTTVYEDARQILLQRLAVGETGDLRLVRQGHRHWVAPPPEQDDTQASSAPGPLVSVGAAIVEPAEASGELVASAAVTPVPAPRRHRQGIERTRQGTKVLAVLKESDRRLDIATIKQKSKLTDYMTRTTLKALVASNLAIESEEEIGGRWGSKAVYALK